MTPPANTFARSLAGGLIRSRQAARKPNRVSPAAILLLLAGAASASASGPRWMTGAPYFSPTGNPVVWYMDHPQYFTDAGDLSTHVSHAAADALVARAAGIWNVPTSRLVLTQGGVLNEHVSGSNVHASSTGLTFPSDVASSNYGAVQIAVIYDTNGSVTDLMLGTGASDPSGCLENGVTESVDSIVPSGHIQHALLVLNGRCTGSAPEQQLQLQYQLERAFGRVLGLSWSQTNDNVFTGTPTPTYNQALYWPIMHPIDIICGPYSYQCLPQPFTLRPDDISAISQLYPVAAGAVPPGKVATASAGSEFAGTIAFPNSQGMEAVNVVVHREENFWDTPEPWETVSAVTGYSFRKIGATPFVTEGTGAMASLGTTESWREGVYQIQLVPVMAGSTVQSVILTTQPINPLYTGEYAVGPYQGGVMAPSGSSASDQEYFKGPNDFTIINMTPGGAADVCATSSDGSAAAPLPVADNGWWSGSLCSYGHVAWASLPVKANRSLTLEVTATDENGNGTALKAMPGIGVWKSTDPVGSLPTVGVTGSAFNGMVSALTTLPVTVGSAPETLRIALADLRGAGRPDFNYNARVLYADSVSPAGVSAAGGVVTITGMGFRQGNSVLVNGAPATVTSWTATTIVATVPPSSAFGASSAVSASVQVKDVTTGGTTTIPAALAYAAPVETLVEVSAPSGNVATGLAAPVLFSVRAVAPNGVTGRAGKAVTFSAAGGGVHFSACGGAAACTVTTNSAGLATTTVTPTVQGSVVLSAAATTGTVTAAFTAGPSLPDVLRLVGAPTGILTVGAAAPAVFAVSLLAGDGVTPRAGQTVTFTAAGGSVLFGACGAATGSVTTDAAGSASTLVTPTTAGQITLRAASATASLTAGLTAAAQTMHLVSAPSGVGTVGTAAATSFSVKVLAGDGLTPVAGAAVVFSTSGASIRFGACGGASCSLLTDANGVVSSTVTPLAVGAATLSAVGSAGSVTSAITAGIDAVQVVRAPGGIATVGKLTDTAFTVKVLAVDGVTPLAGVSLTLTASGGGVQLGACGAATCTAVTDATGSTTTTVLPTAAGAVTLSATLPSSAGGATATASFTAAPETVRLLSAPSGFATVGKVTGTALLVKVLAGDGVTPVAGVSLTLTANGGGVQLGACGAASCTVITDATGSTTTTVLPTAAGAVTLSATLPPSAGGAVATANFTAAAETLRLLSAPSGTVTVGKVTSAAFALRVLAGDGVTPIAGEIVAFAALGGAVRLGSCAQGAASCTAVSDAGGLVSVTVTPNAAGSVTLSAALTASAASSPVTATFTAASETMHLLSAPAGPVLVGSAATSAFAVRVVQGDGVTPAAGETVTFSATAGNVQFGACGSASCAVLTDATGTASTPVTATSAGPIVLAASSTAGTATASFAATPLPDLFRTLSAPSGMVFVGEPGASALTVQVLRADGVTPVAGAAVVFSVSAGAATLSACGASQCAVSTNAAGVASTALTATAAGPVSVTATGGAGTTTATVTAVVRVRSVTALQSAEYVAEGATVLWMPKVAVADNGGPTGGVTVSWAAAAGGSGISFAAATSTVDAQGIAGIVATLGPLAAGVEADATVCAWSGVCASIAARGVGQDALRVAVVSGGGQVVAAADPFGSVVLEVTDGAGHPVAGATVTLHQTVSEWEPACPAQGRCPVAAVFEAGVTTAVSDANGLLTVSPMQRIGRAEVTQIAAVVGSQGFATAEVTKQP